MRKLVILCYGVLKNRAPIDPDRVSKRSLDNTLSGSATGPAARKHFDPRKLITVTAGGFDKKAAGGGRGNRASPSAAPYGRSRPKQISVRSSPGSLPAANRFTSWRMASARESTWFGPRANRPASRRDW
jgi:hypothetical protein